MTTSNFWTSLRTSLILQRFHCLSPFSYNHHTQKLQSKWPVLFYTFLYLTLYVTIVFISIHYLSIFKYLKDFLPVGFMWIALSGFEFFFTNVTFVLIVLILTFKRGAQMEFLQTMADVDSQLMRQFGIQVDQHQMKHINNYAWLIMSIYYQGFAIVLSILVYRTNLVCLVPIIFAYQLAQVTGAGLAFIIVNYMLILKWRFALVRHIYDGVRQEYFIVGSRRHKDTTIRRITIVYHLFKALCDSVGTFNRAFGLVALIRLAHEFTLLNTQLYLVFWLARDAKTMHDLLFIGVALVWMLPNILKIGGMTSTVESALDEVIFTHLNGYNRLDLT